MRLHSQFWYATCAGVLFGMAMYLGVITDPQFAPALGVGLIVFAIRMRNET